MAEAEETTTTAPPAAAAAPESSATEPPVSAPSKPNLINVPGAGKRIQYGRYVTFEAVRSHLDSGAPAGLEVSDMYSKFGKCPLLFWAAVNGDEAAVELLISAGASIDARAEVSGETVLAAAKRLHPEHEALHALLTPKQSPPASTPAEAAPSPSSKPAPKAAAPLGPVSTSGTPSFTSEADAANQDYLANKLDYIILGFRTGTLEMDVFFSGLGGVADVRRVLEESFRDQLAVCVFRATTVEGKSVRSKTIHLTYVGPGLPAMRKAKVSSYNSVFRAKFASNLQIQTDDLDDVSDAALAKALRAQGLAADAVVDFANQAKA